jgi:NAD(P)-dependent dehydrogenase (short-subunit alcohol dehydrogenase family)
MNSQIKAEPMLITGCSSGIGRAAAIRLHDAGLRVYATARRPATLAGLADQGIATLALDVTDEASLTAAAAQVEKEAGPVGTLINNARYGLYGPVEQLPMAEIRREFETNFLGLVRLIQLVLPGMRRRGGGRILNVSSAASTACPADTPRRPAPRFCPPLRSCSPAVHRAPVRTIEAVLPRSPAGAGAAGGRRRRRTKPDPSLNHDHPPSRKIAPRSSGMSWLFIGSSHPGQKFVRVCATQLMKSRDDHG